ncbi:MULTISPECIES: hypothetical protein [unclassified Bradyrhizobium]|uniref:hypothetical protein n=1 Tax=unclassified Bradyrhizobium TaxID=2631580 RepID=UPI001BA8E323|nr:MULTISPECIES: hypothetical protein [unclassified Bradyrhizobium]MBR1215356.1 hypothetical protein [Bradyrhizobium sp. JYMT SZCCT0180]MBR1226698.1 hypothetical protein [Bradyrhizobium sp. AUGA SZCCT0176]MBR1271576.1 hypothetical protein [Bradyrhizobium sp. AUGA SZCCT0222]MBR1299476.1 hypothetical protein [Bradyrhizobium sp. AUGA SZCCT0042]
MKRDIGVISGATLAIGVVMWAFVGNPASTKRTNIAQHVTQTMDVAPELKHVTERSPYMRSER